jgi:hypothetical protein
MARIRTVKPEFWTDETVGEASVSARLLLIASLNFADDYGGLERSSKQLKAQAFPYDAIDCEPLVLELIRLGLLIEYQVADKKYLHIKGFQKHQRVEKPAKPRIPVYEESMRIPIGLPDYSPTTPGGVTVSSLEGIKEGNGSRKGEDQEGSAEGNHARGNGIAKPKPSRQCPPQFELDAAFALKEIPDLDVDREAAKFKDYEFRTPHRNWAATWRTWIRNARDRGNYSKAQGTARKWD